MKINCSTIGMKSAETLTAIAALLPMALYLSMLTSVTIYVHMLSSVLMAYWDWLNNSLNHMHFVDNIMYSLQKFVEPVVAINEYQLCIYINIITFKQKSFITILLTLDINNWCTIYMQAVKVIKFWQCHKSRIFKVIISRVTS